jgi:hypothetical protein
LGRLKWSVGQFWDAEPREFVNAMRGHNKAEDAKAREEWERIRWQTSVLLSPHMKKGSKMKPKDLIEFPWEAEKKKPKMSKEDAMKVIHKL